MLRRFPGAALVALLALTLVLLLGGCVGKGTITGMIQNQTEYYVAGATITVKGTSITTESEPHTGYFTLTGVPAGPQTLVVTKWGFETCERAVDVPIGGTTNVKITQNIAVQSAEVGAEPQFFIYNNTGARITIGTSYADDGQTIILKIAPGEYDLDVQRGIYTKGAHLTAYADGGDAYCIMVGGDPYFQIREQFGGDSPF